MLISLVLQLQASRQEPVLGLSGQLVHGWFLKLVERHDLGLAAELRLEIAVLLFQKEKLTLGQACRLAEMSRLQFQHLLASRQIPLHYDVDEFEDDLLTLEPQDGGKAVVNAGEATLSRWR